jgi:hypothetical protein
MMGNLPAGRSGFRRISADEYTRARVIPGPFLLWEPTPARSRLEGETAARIEPRFRENGPRMPEAGGPA